MWHQSAQRICFLSGSRGGQDERDRVARIAASNAIPELSQRDLSLGFIRQSAGTCSCKINRGRRQNGTPAGKIQPIKLLIICPAKQSWRHDKLAPFKTSRVGSRRQFAPGLRLPRFGLDCFDDCCSTQLDHASGEALSDDARPIFLRSVTFRDLCRSRSSEACAASVRVICLEGFGTCAERRHRRDANSQHQSPHTHSPKRQACSCKENCGARSFSEVRSWRQ